MFSFWFETNRPAAGDVVHRLGLFASGSPASGDTNFNALLFSSFEPGGTTEWN